MRSAIKRGILASALAFLGGCSNFGYYAQSVGGQFDILARARPIGEVVDDPATAADLRTRLVSARAAREFASRELALPDNRSYRNYADLERPFVVWNVFATPELSVKLKEWCFPVAGCVSYRGYFARADAEAYAEGLRREGFEAFVSGVPAYSTLGWFDDPVLSTFIRYPEPEVARLIFHELAHQVVYVKDDSVFNESFATAVETEGMRRWLDRAGSPGQRAVYADVQAKKEQFTGLVLKYRERLEQLYASRVSDQDKRAQKRRILGELREEYAALKASWNGFGGYDRWFGQDLGNAQLASVATYTELVPAFQAVLEENGGDLPRFYAAVRVMAKLPPAERTARLVELAARHPSTAVGAPAASGS
jgi:predicted aminopeptidase